MAEPQAQQDRLSKLVEANIAAVHAYQIGLARSGARKVEAMCWQSSLSQAELEALVAHQAALLGSDPAAVKVWADGGTSSFDPSVDVEPILAAALPLADNLPVNVFTRYLVANTKASRLEARAVANLYQTVMEVERDGTLLQELYRFYIALGLPVYVGQFGLGGANADLLAAGESLAGETCASPFDTDAAAWQIAGRKIWNWGEKNTHIRDATVVAKEILAEPDIEPLIPAIKAMPAQKVAVIGHSFTMDQHWASPSAFAPIAAKMLELENPAVVTRQWFGGGLTASRARRNFYDEALAWKPDKVLFVVALRRGEDEDALKEMVDGFTAAGAKAYCFDTIRDPSEDARRNTFGEDRAKEFGLEVVEVGPVLAASPHRKEFVCLDGIHMTEPYHRLMAKEWLKFLVGARGAKLAGSAH